jgi:filamentous hemagglutinin family protein
MEIMRVTTKGPIMGTTEKYHIYIANHNGIQLNSTHTNNINPTFDTLCKFQQQNNLPLPSPPATR